MAVEPRPGLARQAQPGQIATDAPVNPWAGLRLLKPYAHGIADERPRMDALAVISAGLKVEKNGKSYPQVSRDGTMHIKDDMNRAPGLARELARRGGKSLTIAVVSNDPREVLQQCFAYRSASRLMAYGDEKAMTVIHVRDEMGDDGKLHPVAERKRYPAGTPTYNAAVEKCKAESNFYFVLARWDEQGQPKLIFPDGLGFYRLRFASLNSAEIIRSQLAYIASLPITQGRIAGIPLELSIDYREVSGPDGSRRRVPVWTLVLRPPETIELDVASTTRILETGMEQARGLALPLPTIQTFEEAERDGPDVDLDQAVIDGEAREISAPVRRAGTVDPQWLIDTYMYAVGRTSLRDDDGREAFLLAFTDGRTGSLAEFAATATRRQAEELLKAVADRVGLEIAARNEDTAKADVAHVARQMAAEKPATTGRNYREIFGEDDGGAPPQAAAPVVTEPFVVPADVHVAVMMTGAPAPAADEDTGSEDYRAQLVADIRELIGTANGSGADLSVPEDLGELDDTALEVLHESLLSALEAHAATAGATLA